MDQHQTHCASRSGDVLDTIAFGSMLVFASVMPPLDLGSSESAARRAGQRRGGGSVSVDSPSAGSDSRRVRRRADS